MAMILAMMGALLSRLLRASVAMLMMSTAGCMLFSNQPNVLLSGQEQVPAVATTGFGLGNILVSKDHRISGSIKVSGVEATAVQIHVGAVGKIGVPVMTLNRVSGQVWAVLPNMMLSDAQYLSYKAGELYINVYSSKHTHGEIRGQLRPRRL